jgi:hypothetical protein
VFREESESYKNLVERIDCLQPLEELSLLVHPWWAEERVMSFMICSYADESGDRRAYSMCGLLAKLEDFVELGRQWRIALKEEGLPEFHSAKMENRLPPHEDIDQDRRVFLQRKFIRLITDRKIWGFNAFVELDALKRHSDELAPYISDREPHLFCFRMAVEIMALEIDDYRIKNEPIAFIFDRHKEHEGRAKEIYDHLSTDGKWPLAYRLGSLAFESRLDFVELQAADVWAYESRKHVADAVLQTYAERWQFALFKKAGRFNVEGQTSETMPRFVAALRSGNVNRPKRY